MASKSTKKNIGAAATAITITAAATLASSSTVGAQSAAFTLVDGNNLVPEYIDIEVIATLANATPGSDKTLYAWLAESVDGTNYSGGNPAVGGSDAGYTFASAPVGSSALPTPMRFLGAIVFNAAAQALRKSFRVYDPKAKGVLVLLNFSGQALTACTAQYRTGSGDIR